MTDDDIRRVCELINAQSEALYQRLDERIAKIEQRLDRVMTLLVSA